MPKKNPCGYVEQVDGNPEGRRCVRPEHSDDVHLDEHGAVWSSSSVAVAD